MLCVDKGAQTEFTCPHTGTQTNMTHLSGELRAEHLTRTNQL